MSLSFEGSNATIFDPLSSYFTFGGGSKSNSMTFSSMTFFAFFWNAM